jgi:hypothetical protein
LGGSTCLTDMSVGVGKGSKQQRRLSGVCSLGGLP